MRSKVWSHRVVSLLILGLSVIKLAPAIVPSLLLFIHTVYTLTRV